jgi:hypothetical protein
MSLGKGLRRWKVGAATGLTQFGVKLRSKVHLRYDAIDQTNYALALSLRYSSGVYWLDALGIQCPAVLDVGVILRRLATVEPAIVAHDSDFAVTQLIDSVDLLR